VYKARSAFSTNEGLIKPNTVIYLPKIVKMQILTGGIRAGGAETLGAEHEVR
jgi:hypothetical protein